MKNFFSHPLIKLSKNFSLWKDVINQNILMDMARQRVFVASCVIACAYLTIAVRLIDVMVLRPSTHTRNYIPTTPVNGARKDIVDRNGDVLATQLVTASIYANPKVIINPREAAEKLASIFPEVGFDAFLNKLSLSNRGFIWLVRHIPPKLQSAVHNLGIPGVFLQKDYKRVYPHGPLVSHVLGYCGVDGEGLSGVEKKFNDLLVNTSTSNQEVFKLSIDLKVQHILFDELVNAVDHFRAEGGNAMVIDLKTGEIYGMVSLPAFNPNLPNQNDPKSIFNRNTLGVNEPGSTFKIINTAIALESGTASLSSMYDARNPIKIGKYTITDFKGKYRVLSLTEAFIYSSNIASIKMVQSFGMQTQKEYFKKFGFFKPLKVEVPEIGSPLVPAQWTQATMMTASYGYGISVSPLHTLTAIGGIINNGKKVHPTLLFKNEYANVEENERLVSEKTSKIIRSLMRTAVKEGTSKAANVKGYQVIGKTGTSYKIKGKSYAVNQARTTSFIGALPGDKPRFGLIVMLDDPKAVEGTYGYATGGWNAARVAGKIIERMAPVLGLQPRYEDDDPSPWINASATISNDNDEEHDD